jgi:hypothetical protein
MKVVLSKIPHILLNLLKATLIWVPHILLNLLKATLIWVFALTIIWLFYPLIRFWFENFMR